MKFIMTIDSGNQAIEDDLPYELLRIASSASERMADGEDSGGCYDSNGNRVGEWEVEP